MFAAVEFAHEFADQQRAQAWQQTSAWCIDAIKHMRT